jgi:hypothetical protein
MKIAEIKTALISKIDQSNDEELMQYFYALLTDDVKSISDYPEEIRQSIQKALHESKNDQITPHEEVMKKYKS